MYLPDESIDEFKRIYKEKVGKEISWNEAKTYAEDFLNLFKLISQPIPMKQVKEKNARKD